MGMVIDEVIGHVESDETAPKTAPSTTEAPPKPEAHEPLDQLLRRLQQRQARLRAD